jgi:dGTPase
VNGELPAAIAEYVARHDLELHSHASAEAQVAALSDDIAYVNHDLHDGLRAGLFAEEDAIALPLVGACYAEVDAAWPGLELLRRRHEALRRVFGLMVDDVLAGSRARLAALAPGSAEAVRALGQPVILFSGRMASDIAEIKSFLFRHMYRHFKVRRMRAKAARVVSDLFAILLGDPGLMPGEWSDAAAQAESEELRARIVADYIAGMTDRFALDEHRTLTDPMARA